MLALTLVSAPRRFGARTSSTERGGCRGRRRPVRGSAAALLKLLPAGSKLEDLQPSPIAGIYEFMQGADISYLTADGKYFHRRQSL